jgi:sodium-dependent dicarboxylate transporter 2/3/5
MSDEAAPFRWLARLGFWAGPVVAAGLWFAPEAGRAFDPARPEMNRMAAVAAWMAVWWLTEAAPLAVTSLLPLVLFPLGHILPGREVAPIYGDRDIFLYLGGFLVALAIEESGLHRRLALSIVAAMGDRPRRIVAGVMLATAAISMWTSNTATTMMILPIALAVVGHAEQSSADEVRRKRFAAALVLGVSYAATIGGMATLIGTPTNIAFRAFYEQTYPNSTPVTFLGWMLVATPLAAAMLAAAWALLVGWTFPLGGATLLGGRNTAREDLRGLGPMTSAERRMLAIFLVTAGLWIFREPVPGWGWAAGLGVGTNTPGGTPLEWADDGTVAIAMALVCFLLPSGRKPGEKLLSWQATGRVPWGILFLFGGGLALARGLKVTGLDALLGQQVAAQLGDLSPWAMQAVVAAGVTYLSELTSNVATVNLVMPILAPTASDLGLSPLSLLLPAALAASCGFMLPVATPPNAIAYSTGRLTVRDMVRAGFWLNLIGIALVVLFCRLLGGWALG